MKVFEFIQTGFDLLIVALILLLISKTKQMSEDVNAEVQAYADQVNTATNTIAAELQTILANSTLSAESKQKMEGAISALTALGTTNA